MSRYIPNPIKRSLRKEAGFGCCVCGYPFFEYHHIRPFAELEDHDEKHMMVLCPNHHHQANVSVIDSEKQYLLKKAPYNIVKGYVDGPLPINSRALAVEVGSNQLVGAGFKFVVDQIPLLELKKNIEHHLLLSMDLYDPEDNLLISITDNEWISGDPLPWDFEYNFNWLRLRRKDRVVSIEIDARKEPLSLLGDLYLKKQNFSIKMD